MQELRLHAAGGWTLASDRLLLSELEELSGRLLVRANETKRAVDALVVDGERCQARVHDAFNRFRLLSNTQFLEQRVAEEPPSARDGADGAERASTPDRGAADDSEASVAERYREAFATAASATRGRWVFPRPRVVPPREPGEDPSATPAPAPPPAPSPRLVGSRFWRPLPHVIGTQEFYQDDTLGVDPTRAIAPDAATAAAVTGAELPRDGFDYRWESDTDGSDDDGDVSDTESSDVSSDTSTEISDDTEDEYDDEDDEDDDDAREGGADGPGPARDFRAMVEARLREPSAASETASEASEEEDIFGGSTAATTPTTRHAREGHTDANANVDGDGDGDATLRDPFAGAGARLGGGASARSYNVSFADVFGGGSSERLFGDEVDDDAFGGGAASTSNVAGESTRAAMDPNATAAAAVRSAATAAPRSASRPAAAAAAAAGLFGDESDDDERDLFGGGAASSSSTFDPARPAASLLRAKAAEAANRPKPTRGSLFDDDDDGGIFGVGAGAKSGTDDIFAGPLLSDPLAGRTVAPAARTTPTPTPTPAETRAQTRAGGLFDDDDDAIFGGRGEAPPVAAPVAAPSTRGKAGGLFDDDEEEDGGGGLFGSSKTAEAPRSTEPAPTAPPVAPPSTAPPVAPPARSKASTKSLFDSDDSDDDGLFGGHGLARKPHGGLFDDDA